MDNFSSINVATRCYLAWIATGLRIAKYNIDSELKLEIIDIALEGKELPARFAEHNEFFKVASNFANLSAYLFKNIKLIDVKLPDGRVVEELTEEEFREVYGSYLVWKRNTGGKV